MGTVTTLPRRTSNTRLQPLRSQLAHSEALLRRTFDGWERGLMEPEHVCEALGQLYMARTRFANAQERE